MHHDSPLRRVRSYVLRTSRLTAAQARALETRWDALGFDAKTPLDQQAVFGREAPLWIEIGIGNGDALVHAAQMNPSHNLLGIEVHTPGIGHCILNADQRGIDNIRLCTKDATEVLEHCIGDNSLEQCNLFFPDPWHKKRHHKRRIVNDKFVDLVHRKLIKGGTLHMATDWEDYAEWMQETLARHQDRFAKSDHPPSERPAWRPLTRFENRGQKLGHRINDLIYHAL